MDGIRTVIYPVRDLERAKALMSELVGADPTSDTPHYVGFTVGGQEIGLDPNGHSAGLTGPLAYWHVSDIEATLQGMLSAGAVAGQPVTDVGGGKLIASVADPDGNVIGLIQAS